MTKPTYSQLCFGCSSPHLVQVRERIRINGQPIGKELFTKYFWQVYGRLYETKVSLLLKTGSALCAVLPLCIVNTSRIEVSAVYYQCHGL